MFGRETREQVEELKREIDLLKARLNHHIVGFDPHPVSRLRLTSAEYLERRIVALETQSVVRPGDKITLKEVKGKRYVVKVTP